MVRQWQTLFYNQRYSNTVLHSGPDDVNPEARGTRVPDFVKLSEAMGCYAIRCEDPADLTRSSRRPTRSTTARSSWTSWSTRTRWCGRWSPPAPPTTRSWPPGTSAPTSATTRTTESRRDSQAEEADHV